MTDGGSSSRREHSIAKHGRRRSYFTSSDNALTKAIFRAQVRHHTRKQDTGEAPPKGDEESGDLAQAESRPAWRIWGASLLLVGLIGSLFFFVYEIIVQTRPFPAPPPVAVLGWTLPPGLERPQIAISFVPGPVGAYVTSDGPAGAIGPGSTLSPPLGLRPDVRGTDGRPIDVSQWTPSGAWKVLVDVTATFPAGLPTTSNKPPIEILAGTVNSSTFSHFVADTPSGCGNPQVEKGRQSKAFREFSLYPCEYNGRRFLYRGEGILRYPIESSTGGHVAGALPEIDVFACQDDRCKVRKKVEFRVVVYERYQAADGGLQNPGLSAVDVSPKPSVAPDVLLWNTKGPLNARWSWAVTQDVNHSQAIINIYLVLVGVTSALLVTLSGYLVKGQVFDRLIVWFPFQLQRSLSKVRISRLWSK